MNYYNRKFFKTVGGIKWRILYVMGIFYIQKQWRS